jgi:hypothetical protein
VLAPTEVGSGESGDVDERKLEATVTPTLGNYTVHLEGRCQGDGTNGTAEFFDRWIRITKS